MPRPLVATKLFVPGVRPGLVPRPRLLERLRRGSASRLTLVAAPAGFGKTTLLAEWLADQAGERPAVAWVSLDVGEQEPVTFWTYVATALGGVVPGAADRALELLESTGAVTELVLGALVNGLAEAQREVVLVLDDYHLADSPEVSDGLAFLVDRLPPQAHVVLGTRADPRLPLARVRVRGELVEIRAADLRFTDAEVADYLRAATGLDLSSDQVQALEERTEGWVAALQLAALSLQGRDDVSSFVDQFAGTDRFVLDYLVEEVLHHQPAPTRRFLLCASVLDRLTGPLCDAVTGGDDGAAVLEHLERANLFVVPLDDRRQWFRFHHLFADVLRARLAAEQPELVPLLHQRASQWFADHGLADEAIAHALAAPDLDRAVHLIELTAPEIRRHRRESVLLGWLGSLPDDAIRRSPVLSAFRGFRSLVAGDLDLVESWLQAAERAIDELPDPEGAMAQIDELRTLPSTIAVYRASLAQARGDVPGTVDQATRALELAGPEDHLARGAANGFLGLAAWARGEVGDALTIFSDAVSSLHAAGNVVDELSAAVLLADLLLVAGEADAARRLLESTLARAEATGPPMIRATSELHVAISELDVKRGDLDAARVHLRAAAPFVETGPMTESRYRWFVAMGLLADTEGDLERAITLLDRAEEFYRAGFYPDVRPVAALRARVWIHHGDLAQAAGWARARGLSVSDEASYAREFDQLTLALLLIAQHRADPVAARTAPTQVVDLLQRLEEVAVAQGRAGSLVEIRRLLLTAWDGAATTAETDRTRQHRVPDDAPVDALSGREVQVLRLLDSELSGPQIARELFISHNTLRTHTKHIFTKLGVTNRRAAVARARDHRLL